MVAGVIQLDFSITGIDSQTLLIAEKGVARLFWPLAELGFSPSSSGHQRSGAFMGSIGFIGDIGFIPDIGSMVSSWFVWLKPLASRREWPAWV